HPILLWAAVRESWGTSTQPAAIEFHDSAFSGGTRVRCKSRHYNGIRDHSSYKETDSHAQVHSHGHCRFRPRLDHAPDAGPTGRRAAGQFSAFVIDTPEAISLPLPGPVPIALDGRRDR